MSEPTQARVKAVFLEAVDTDPEMRAELLDRRCGDRADLRREVESLLAHHDPVSIVESAPGEDPRAGARSAASDLPMRRPVRRRPGSLVALLTAVACAGAPVRATPKVDLSPRSWDPGELEQLSQIQGTFGTDHPLARGDKGIVVGTTGALAVRSGVEALRQGGNAIDAVMATSLAQITLMAGATVSFAGKLSLVYYEAATGEVHYLNAVWDVPAAEDGQGIPRCGFPHGRQVLVHGYMAGLEAAHQRFGALPFKSLFGPAIYFARQGFEIAPFLSEWIGFRFDVITRLPEGREIFTDAAGSQYGEGDWFRQPKLAKTLKRVSRKGARHLYRGGWARRLVKAVQAQGGRLSMNDLRAYEPSWIAPRSFEFDGHAVHAPREPGIGGAHLQAVLGGLDADALRSAGHYTASADSLAALVEGLERRNDLLGTQGDHSDGVVAVDSDGNVAALLHTINTDLWGSTGIFVDGISIADTGCWAQAFVQRAGAGGRIDSVENPVVITRNGAAVGASSAIGSGLYPTTSFSLVNLLAYGMDPKAAVGTPTFHQSSFPGTGAVHRVTAGEFSTSLLDTVRGRGFTIEEHQPGHGHLGFWIALALDPSTDQWTGATPDLNGLAMAE